MIVEIEVILGRAIIVVEVIRVREAIFVEEIIRRILTVEIEIIEEVVEAEREAGVTTAVLTQRCQQKSRRIERIMKISKLLITHHCIFL